MKTDLKRCQRCFTGRARKGNRYCDRCEAIVIEEMKRDRYLESRHIRAANVETGKQPSGAR